MAYRVAWTESAWQELETAAEYIARDSPHFASALMHEAQLAAQSLKRFPQRGRIVPELTDASIREIFVKRYRLIYEIGARRIVILSFLHGARQFPETI